VPQTSCTNKIQLLKGGILCHSNVKSVFIHGTDAPVPFAVKSGIKDMICRQTAVNVQNAAVSSARTCMTGLKIVNVVPHAVKHVRTVTTGRKIVKNAQPAARCETISINTGMAFAKFAGRGLSMMNPTG
jgi:hypothetical protein